MKFIKNSFSYIFVFLFSLSTFIFFAFFQNSIDAIWNYGFSFAIAHGQIPYRDFTMIIPPLYNYVMAIGLCVWDNNLMFLIEQSLLITICFFVLVKMYQKRAWLFLVALCFPSFVAFIPTYNFFLFFLVVLILFLEQRKGNDYLIGFLIACTIITKYTVGFFFILPSFILYFGNWKKIGKRAIGCILPCVFFLLYLLCTKSFIAFFDLCFLGLFDFAATNSVIFTPYFYLSILILCVEMFILKRNRKNPVIWYSLFAFFVLLPIFTHNHFYVYLLFFSLVIMEFLPIFSFEKFIPYFCWFVCFMTVFCDFFLSGAYKRLERFQDVPHFEYMYDFKGTKETVLAIRDLYHKYQELGPTKLLYNNTVFIQIVDDEEFDYFSILNRGNYGYHGSEKLIRKIQKMPNTYFIIDKNEYIFSKTRSIYNYEISQFDYVVVDYVMEHSTKVEEWNFFEVYYYEG